MSAVGSLSVSGLGRTSLLVISLSRLNDCGVVEDGVLECLSGLVEGVLRRLFRRDLNV